MIYDINRFHFFAMLMQLFSGLFGAQILFSIFGNYVPNWKCSLKGVDDGVSYFYNFNVKS